MYILQRNGNVEIGKLLPPYTIIYYIVIIRVIHDVLRIYAEDVKNPIPICLTL